MAGGYRKGGIVIAKGHFATQSSSYRAGLATNTVPTFKVGQLVRVKRNGTEKKIEAIPRKDEYQLEGIKGTFGGSQLELVK